MRIPQQRRNVDYGSMTSMIDIVFLLLIFFVIGAAGATRELLLPTELPPAGAVAAAADQLPPPQQVEVWLKVQLNGTGATVVDMNGTVYDDLTFLKGQLRTLAELDPANPVILDIQPVVPLGDVVEIYDTCQAAGFQKIEFAAGAVAIP